MKLLRCGQSTPLLEAHYLKIRQNFFTDRHRLILDVAYFTGERWGAILQLRVGDVYEDARSRSPRNQITFKAQTRKDKVTRQVPVCQKLRTILKGYQPEGCEDDWLFPSLVNPENSLSMRAIDNAFRRAIAKARLDGLGYSTHSTRRGFITQLHEKGVSVKVIQSITGHKSLACLSRYIDVSERQRESAIALL